MTPRTPSEQELQVDDWAAGTLPDYQRGQVEQELSRNARFAAHASDARTIIRAARSEALALPSEAYFADLQLRIEDRMESEGLPLRPLVIGRRARLLSAREVAAALSAVAAAAFWLAVVVSPAIDPAIPEAATEAITSINLSPTINLSQAAHDRNRQIAFILLETRDYV